jgi:hypothetical protein
MGRVVYGATCLWGELSMGRSISIGRDVDGARCSWGELSTGASCPWGKMSWGELRCGKLSGNHFHSHDWFSLVLLKSPNAAFRAY